MRTLFNFMVTTVDGYYEGPNGEFDWPLVDDEFNNFAIEQLNEIGTLLFGRVTYDVMAAYWPTPQAEQNDPKVAALMNDADKLVASTTLTGADWANSRLISGDVIAELTELKKQDGKAIAIFGSSNLTAHLLKAGLVDELRIMVHPVILGDGKSLFHQLHGSRISLRRTRTVPFSSGNVLHHYQPVSG
jgi:dihydrofolate reductase